MVNHTYGAPNHKSAGCQGTKVTPCISWRSRPSPGKAKIWCSLTPMYKAKKAVGNSNSAATEGITKSKDCCYLVTVRLYLGLVLPHPATLSPLQQENATAIVSTE